MDHVDRQVLEAYLDGELDAAAVQRVEAHVRACDACAQELASARHATSLISDYRFNDITDDELQRLHAAIDELQDQRAWRIGGALGTIAASILIISLAWLNAMPRTAPAQSRPQLTVSAPAWEQVAMTLRAGPLPAGSPIPQTDLALSHEAQTAEWMLQGLGSSAPAPLPPGKQLP